MSRLLAALLILTALVAGCASPATTPSTPTGGTTTTPTGSTGNGTAGSVGTMAAGEYTATLVTTMGTIKLQLYADKAPLSVANFLQHAEEGAFDGTVFHRVIKGFVIQGGGFPAPFAGGQPRPTSYGPIPTEIWSGSQHDEGTLGMARTNDPNSGTGQWFINTARNQGLDSGYTVFGKVTEGMDVVHSIENVPTGTKAGMKDVPTEDVVLTKATVTTPAVAPTPTVALYHDKVAVAASGKVSTPVYVRNVGGGRLTATLSGTGTNGLTVAFPRSPGALSGGQAGVAIAEITAPAGFTGGAVDVTATAGDKTATAHLQVEPLTVSGGAAGPDHPKVSTYYIGLYDNGITFDTTSADLAQHGFPMPAGFQPHPEPLTVYVGSGSSDDARYMGVIPGFASGIVGLHAGETRTVRLTSDEGYKDGYFRLFEMNVKSVDS